MSNTYKDFLQNKRQLEKNHGFKPLVLHDQLFDFQKWLVEWAVLKGRCALYEDCGLGKTFQQLAWADNIVRKTNKKVLLFSPLAVGAQTVMEGEKFGIECAVSKDGSAKSDITITNYEKIHLFDSNDFIGVVCDESSCIKNFNGKRKAAVTEFMRLIPYRLLCTATAAPNDFIELGTSSESLGELGYMDMLSKFFKNDKNSNHPNRQWSQGVKWRFRGHSQDDFWRWVCSWARAIKKPSDIGFADAGFDLPELIIKQHVITASTPRYGYLFDIPAVTLAEQREERRRTLPERCEKAAALVDPNDPVVIWGNLNDECDYMEKIIPGALQVSGKDSDDKKEEKFAAFLSGECKALITKPKIGGLGLNWQHCAHQIFFPSHSFEQWYQAIRRSWRFGQKRDVTVDVVTSEGESRVIENLQRKAKSAEIMFSRLIQFMNRELVIEQKNNFVKKEEVPAWL